MAAKRRILDEVLPRLEAAEDSYDMEHGRVPQRDTELVRRLMAQPYVSHPDYDPAWRP